MRLPVTARRLTVFTLVDDEDGELIGGRKLSIGSHGYVQIWDADAQKLRLLHRLIMGATQGDGRIVDHVSRDRLDNRKANLRFVTAAESSGNITPHASSGYRGVYRMRNRWQAKAQKDGKLMHLGTFDTREAAAAVSDAWRKANLPGYVS